MKLGFIDILVSLAFSLVVVLGLSLNREMKFDSIQLVQITVDTGRPLDWEEKQQSKEDIVVRYERPGAEPRSVTISDGDQDLVRLSPDRRVDDLWINKTAWMHNGELELVGQIHPNAEIHVEVVRSWQVTESEKELIDDYSDALAKVKSNLYHASIEQGASMLWFQGDGSQWASRLPKEGVQIGSEWKRDVAESLLRDIEEKGKTHYKYPRRAVLFLLAEECARDGEILSDLIRPGYRDILEKEVLIGHKYVSERYPTPVPFDTSQQDKTLKLAPTSLDARFRSTELFVLESYMMRWLCGPVKVDGFISGEPMVYSTYSRVSHVHDRLHGTFALTQNAETPTIRTSSEFVWNVQRGCR